MNGAKIQLIDWGIDNEDRKIANDIILRGVINEPKLKELKRLGLLTEEVHAHHIIPRSWYIDNNDYNLVLLTVREHALIHWHYTQFCTGELKFSMANAYSLIVTGNEYKGQQLKFSDLGKYYENIKMLPRGKDHPCSSGEYHFPFGIYYSSREAQDQIHKDTGLHLDQAEVIRICGQNDTDTKLDKRISKNYLDILNCYGIYPKNRYYATNRDCGNEFIPYNNHNTSGMNNGTNNWQHDGNYVDVSWGRFINASEASKAINRLILHGTIRDWCYKSDKMFINKSKYQKNKYLHSFIDYCGVEKSFEYYGFGFGKYEDDTKLYKDDEMCKSIIEKLTNYIPPLEHRLF